MPSPVKYRIMVCPLDWGLGHATRCIPLIRELIQNGAEVILASDGPQLELLRMEFPAAEWVRFPGYRVRYGEHTGAAMSILLKSPGLLFHIVKEQFLVRSLIRKYRINGLISDNRYGLWNRRIHTAFVTHQLNIIAPAPLRFAEPMLRSAVRYFVKKFDHCWVPDHPGDNNLSGRLSHGHPLPENVAFIGPLSRLSGEYQPLTAPGYDVVALISGPEPQRTVFEEKLIERLPVNGKRCLIVRGIPGEPVILRLKENLDVVNHLPTRHLRHILRQDPFVICRSGYSTLMDLAYTGNRALLVPTPGQTEQEYLAGYHRNRGFHQSASQDNINPDDAFRNRHELLKPDATQQYTGHQAFITGFLSRIAQA